MGPLSRPNHRQLSYHLARRFSGRRVDPVYYNREINREFSQSGHLIAIFASDQRADSIAYSRIPYATEQGIFAAITGNFFRITGNLIERAANALKLHSPLL